MDIELKQKVSLERISNLLTSAFEGGSNYWYMVQEKVQPQKLTFKEFPEDQSTKAVYLTEYVLNEGGALLIDDENADEPILKEPVRLDLAAVKKGVGVMADLYPRHYADLLTDDGDADTGDVFLQCCIFGEAIYG